MYLYILKHYRVPVYIVKNVLFFLTVWKIQIIVSHHILLIRIMIIQSQEDTMSSQACVAWVTWGIHVSWIQQFRYVL